MFLFLLSHTHFSLLRTLYPHVCCVLSCSSCVRLLATASTVAHQAPLYMGILQARTPEWVAMPSSRGSSQPRDQTQIPHIAGRFCTIWATSEAQEHFLQRIFLTQELNQGLLHCRQILYQLSYQGSPFCSLLYVKCLKHCLALGKESEVAQLCLTLCDPMDCSPPGSSIHWIF